MLANVACPITVLAVFCRDQIKFQSHHASSHHFPVSHSLPGGKRRREPGCASGTPRISTDVLLVSVGGVYHHYDHGEGGSKGEAKMATKTTKAKKLTGKQVYAKRKAAGMCVTCGHRKGGFLALPARERIFSLAELTAT